MARTVPGTDCAAYGLPPAVGVFGVDFGARHRFRHVSRLVPGTDFDMSRLVPGTGIDTVAVGAWHQVRPTYTVPGTKYVTRMWCLAPGTCRQGTCRANDRIRRSGASTGGQALAGPSASLTGARQWTIRDRTAGSATSRRSHPAAGRCPPRTATQPLRCIADTSQGTPDFWRSTS